MSKIKRFIETSITYLAGNVLSKLIALFMLPLYTSRLSPDQYGAYDLSVSIISFILPVTFFQVWDGMYRYAFDYKEAHGKYSVISNSFFISLVGAVIYSIFLWGIFSIFRFENVFLIFIYGLTLALNYQYTFISRVFIKNKLFVISGLINSLLSAIINIVLILEFNLGVESLYIAPIIGCLVQVLIIEKNINPLKNIRIWQINKKMMYAMLSFSIPLSVATISYWLLSGYTRVIIFQELGAYENGIYAVASKFAAMITLLVSVFQYAWNEMAYLMSGDDDRLIKYEKGVQYIFKVVILGSGIFIFAIKLFFPIFIDVAYQEALTFIPITLIGVAINAFAGFIGTIFLTEKKTSWILRTTIFVAIINVVCCWIFTHIWGLQGAVSALSLSFIILAFIRLLVAIHVFNLKLPYSNVLYIILLCVVLYLYFLIEKTALLILITLLLCVISVYSFREVLFVIWRFFIKRERSE